MRRAFFPVMAGTYALAGGVYFGLFSCGGYTWHRQLFGFVFVAALVVTVMLPPRALRTWPRRLAFIASALVVFILTEAAASAFYPATPSSWDEFEESFKMHLQTGTC